MQISLLPEEVEYVIETITKHHSTQPAWVGLHLVDKLVRAKEIETEIGKCKHTPADYVGKSNQCSKCGQTYQFSWTLITQSCRDKRRKKI